MGFFRKLAAFVEKFWAPIAIAIAAWLLGVGKVKRAKKRVDQVADLYCDEKREQLDAHAGDNSLAKEQADQATAKVKAARKQFGERVNEIGKMDDDIDTFLGKYESRRMRREP